MSTLVQAANAPGESVFTRGGAMNVRPRGRDINLLIVVDTRYVKNVYGPNDNVVRPRRVLGGTFMVCTGSLGMIGAPGTSKQRFWGQVGDCVSIRATSICRNSEDAVILYRVQPASGQKVFNHFEAKVVRKAAAQPDPNSLGKNGLPAVESETSFLSFDARVRAPGIEELEIDFALYALSPLGMRQDLFGYYACYPVIAVVYPPDLVAGPHLSL